MRTTKQTGQFKRDLKRESRGPHRKALQDDFVAVIVKPHIQSAPISAGAVT